MVRFEELFEAQVLDAEPVNEAMERNRIFERAGKGKTRIYEFFMFAASVNQSLPGTLVDLHSDALDSGRIV